MKKVFTIVLEHGPLSFLRACSIEALISRGFLYSPVMQCLPFLFELDFMHLCLLSGVCIVKIISDFASDTKLKE